MDRDVGPRTDAQNKAYSQQKTALDAVNGALGTYMTAGQKAKAMADAEAKAAGMSKDARESYLATERKRIELAGQVMTADERGLQMDAARTSATIGRTSATRDAIDTATQEAAAAEAVAAGYGKSEVAGARAAAVQAALLQAERGQISAGSVMAVAYGNLTKSVDDFLAKQAETAAGYGREEAAAGALADAAGKGAAAEKIAADQNQVSERYAKALADAYAALSLATGNDRTAAQARVDAVKQAMAADEAHLKVLRDKATAQDLARANLQGAADIAYSQQSLALSAGGYGQTGMAATADYDRAKTAKPEFAAMIRALIAEVLK